MKHAVLRFLYVRLNTKRTIYICLELLVRFRCTICMLTNTRCCRSGIWNAKWRINTSVAFGWLHKWKKKPSPFNDYFWRQHIFDCIHKIQRFHFLEKEMQTALDFNQNSKLNCFNKSNCCVCVFFPLVRIWSATA